MVKKEKEYKEKQGESSSLIQDFLDAFKFSRKTLTWIIIGLITILPIVYRLGIKIDKYTCDVDEIGLTLTEIKTSISELKQEHNEFKEKQNQLYYNTTENIKLTNEKLEFIINHRSEDKKFIIDAIRILDHSQSTLDDKVTFKATEITNTDSIVMKKPKGNIIIKKK